MHKKLLVVSLIICSSAHGSAPEKNTKPQSDNVEYSQSTKLQTASAFLMKKIVKERPTYTQMGLLGIAAIYYRMSANHGRDLAATHTTIDALEKRRDDAQKNQRREIRNGVSYLVEGGGGTIQDEIIERSYQALSLERSMKITNKIAKFALITAGMLRIVPPLASMLGRIRVAAR